MWPCSFLKLFFWTKHTQTVTISSLASLAFRSVLSSLWPSTWSKPFPEKTNIGQSSHVSLLSILQVTCRLENNYKRKETLQWNSYVNSSVSLTYYEKVVLVVIEKLALVSISSLEKWRRSPPPLRTHKSRLDITFWGIP